jgi:hypothetical protein
MSWSARMSADERAVSAGQSSTDYVDMSPQHVRDASDAMSRTAESLRAAARTGNREVIGDQLAPMEIDSRGACHLSSTR